MASHFSTRMTPGDPRILSGSSLHAACDGLRRWHDCRSRNARASRSSCLRRAEATRHMTPTPDRTERRRATRRIALLCSSFEIPILFLLNTISTVTGTGRVRCLLCVSVGPGTLGTVLDVSREIPYRGTSLICVHDLCPTPLNVPGDAISRWCPTVHLLNIAHRE